MIEDSGTRRTRTARRDRILQRFGAQLGPQVVCVFPNRASCLRLIGAQLLEVHEAWLAQERPYLNMEKYPMPAAGLKRPDAAA